MEGTDEEGGPSLPEGTSGQDSGPWIASRLELPPLRSPQELSWPQFLAR